MTAFNATTDEKNSNSIQKFKKKNSTGQGWLQPNGGYSVVTKNLRTKKLSKHFKKKSYPHILALPYQT